MNKSELNEYLKIVAQNGYGNKKSESNWEKNPDGSTTIKHEKGDWSMRDNFFGGEPYGGREVIFYQGKPVWIMVYYGEVIKDITNVGEIYGVLQDALLRPDQETPIRGPKVFVKGNLKYEAEWDGDILKFSGKEKILINEKEVYTATYMGGLVDQREE